MKFSTTLKLSLDALRRQKTRSLLTILGTSVGIAIVIAIMSAGRGLDSFIMDQISIYGSDMLDVETKIPNLKKTSNENAFGQAQGITITTLKNKDIEAVKKHPNVASAYGWIMTQQIVSYAGQNKTTLIAGEGYNMPDVEKFTLAEGRMFSEEEEKSLGQVAVLGWAVKETFFGDDTALDKIVHIKGKPFRVVGVAAKRGSSFFMDMDNMVIVPTETAQKRLMGVDYLSAIMVKMKDASLAQATAEEITEIMREQHGITNPDKDDFAVNTMDEAKNMLGQVVAGITFLLVALVCISLVVGGVGIMNIMYVSVAERTFEIGLRKALGAKPKDILYQFLFESIVITLLGGVAGIIFGAILALIIYLVAIYYNLAWVYSIPISSIILAVGFSAFIGLIFGLYPARKAAGLDPIVAIRRE